MSSDLTWELVKRQSSFLVKRNGITLTAEPGNLTQTNSYKWSGLANAKTVNIAFAKGDNAKGAIVSTRRVRAAAKPAKAGVPQTFGAKGGVRRAVRKVSALVGPYRGDLVNAAKGRLSRILAAQVLPVRPLKQRKVRGAKSA